MLADRRLIRIQATAGGGRIIHIAVTGQRTAPPPPPAPDAPPRRYLRSAVAVPREALPPRIDRDPCPRCGTRGDLGCRHGRAGVNW
ncbi:hypothetical protein [Sphingomonas hengshuiensis]|uniref:hypothetical protein n=1 Tax=Sphingomonas hengshuiensis TaxID=1609977 RepID=UPI0009822898|nr:hypothetical protein [Sphingomonas hengshuiensis]